MLDAETLRKLLNYDPETGSFTWACKRNNRTQAGSLAGRIRTNGHGYRCLDISVNGKRYLAHRLAWLYVNGRWPTHQIDHLNGNALDNRISNLREATRVENARNKGVRSDNSSGYKGVARGWKAGRWTAFISVDGKRQYLGTFDSAESAHDAYACAARRAHGAFVNLGIEVGSRHRMKT